MKSLANIYRGSRYIAPTADFKPCNYNTTWIAIQDCAHLVVFPGYLVSFPLPTNHIYSYLKSPPYLENTIRTGYRSAINQIPSSDFDWWKDY
jgi:hypothetical protein